MNSNQQSNRLQLNFGGGDRNQYQDAGRAFPTTPSTFPQPIGQQEVWGAQQQQQQQQQGNGYSGGGGSSGGYFQNPYQQAQYQGQQGNLQTQHLQQRFDANGLAQQLSSQHLGGSGRSGSPYGRQPSPNPQRPRTADNRGYSYGSYGASQGPRQPSLYDEEAPKRQPEKYSDNVEKQATMSKSLINTFFKDSVQRARDRNQR
jgi:protein-serine/threonine kinase